MKRLITAVVMVLTMSVVPHVSLAADGLKSARILPGWRTKSGAHIAALELDLQDGWKTYWRSPGETGFPPQFNWQDSDNVERVEVLWPAPRRYAQDGVVTIGYAGRVVLPFRIYPKNKGQDIDLKSVIDLGVCKDICVPLQLNIEETLSAVGGKRSGLIAGALADRPLTAKEAGVGGATCVLEQPKKGVALTARVEMPRKWDTEMMVIEPADPSLYVEQSETERQGNVLTSRALISSPTGSAVLIQRNDLRITVIGDSGAVEIVGCTAGG